MEKPAGRCVRRALAFTPTSLSGLLLALCALLPLGTYRGCGKTSQVLIPSDRQAQAFAQGNVQECWTLAAPYATGLMIGLCTLLASVVRRRWTFDTMWALYAAIVCLECGFAIWRTAELGAFACGDPAYDSWRQHGSQMLAIFGLLALTAATRCEARSAFTAAMTLQCFLIALIWLNLCGMFLFLEELLIGGALTLFAAGMLPLGTVLQIYGDPSAGQLSLCALKAAGDPSANGIPQFTLRNLLIVTTLLAGGLAIGQAWGAEKALAFVYFAAFAGLAWRRLRQERAGRLVKCLGRVYVCAALVAASTLVLVD